mmetsp:Transcript_5349/g.13390  ORF Transcript_5349/g.13390 Transcript_5349/m.13390 type:complete len:200 (+) Transcript_5349:489-1088(+)
MVHIRQRSIRVSEFFMVGRSVKLSKIFICSGCVNWKRIKLPKIFIDIIILRGFVIGNCRHMIDFFFFVGSRGISSRKSLKLPKVIIILHRIIGSLRNGLKVTEAFVFSIIGLFDCLKPLLCLLPLSLESSTIVIPFNIVTKIAAQIFPWTSVAFLASRILNVLVPECCRCRKGIGASKVLLLIVVLLHGGFSTVSIACS